MQELIKEIMQEQGETYASLAAKCGWTAQNVWDKLNNRKNPSFSGLRRILLALGYDFAISYTRVNKHLEETDTFPEPISESADDTEAAFSVVEATLNSVGYSIGVKKI